MQNLVDSRVVYQIRRVGDIFFCPK